MTHLFQRGVTSSFGPLLGPHEVGVTGSHPGDPVTVVFLFSFRALYEEHQSNEAKVQMLLTEPYISWIIGINCGAQLLLVIMSEYRRLEKD